MVCILCSEFAMRYKVPKSDNSGNHRALCARFASRRFADKNNGKTLPDMKCEMCFADDVLVVLIVLNVVPDYVDKIALTAGGVKAAHPADICNQMRVLFCPKLWFSFSLFGLPTQCKYAKLCVFVCAIFQYLGILVLWLHHIIITFNLMLFVRAEQAVNCFFFTFIFYFFCFLFFNTISFDFYLDFHLCQFSFGMSIYLGFSLYIQLPAHICFYPVNNMNNRCLLDIFECSRTNSHFNMFRKHAICVRNVSFFME